MQSTRLPRIGRRNIHLEFQLQTIDTILLEQFCKLRTCRKFGIIGRRFRPIVERELIFCPSSSDSTVKCSGETDISTVNTVFISFFQYLATITPTVGNSHTAMRTVPVKENVTCIIIAELGTSGTINGLHVDIACRSIVRKNKADRSLGYVRNISHFHITGHRNGQRHIRVINEIVTNQCHLTTRLCKLTRNGVHGRSRNQHLEIIIYGILCFGHHINLISHYRRNLFRNIYHKCMVSDVTGIKYRLLVIEIELVNTPQIFTDQTNRIRHISPRQQRVCRCRIRDTNIFQGRLSPCHFIFIRFILTSRHGKACYNNSCREEPIRISIIFHLFKH